MNLLYPRPLIAAVLSTGFAIAALPPVFSSAAEPGVASAVATANADGPTPGERKDGKSLYAVYCSSCHGDTGKGDGKAAAELDPRPKPLSVAMKGKKEAQIKDVIVRGKGKMPGWGQVLDEEQIQEIYRYVKDLNRK